MSISGGRDNGVGNVGSRSDKGDEGDFNIDRDIDVSLYQARIGHSMAKGKDLVGMECQKNLDKITPHPDMHHHRLRLRPATTIASGHRPLPPPPATDHRHRLRPPTTATASVHRPSPPPATDHHHKLRPPPPPPSPLPPAVATGQHHQRSPPLPATTVSGNYHHQLGMKKHKRFLAKRNLAFHGTNEILHVNNNGKFLGLLEMVEFDSIVQDHIQHNMHMYPRPHWVQTNPRQFLGRSLTAKACSPGSKPPYLQNASPRVKVAKYFSVILDCTIDISHEEQKSLILMIFGVALNSLCLDIDIVRGQGYDNDTNMKEKNQGVQKKLLDINHRAYYAFCVSHSLNLTLSELTNTHGKAKDFFFGIIQCIYTILANFTKR
ncbi:hypothetical protein OSB04_001177 [Centaurea solstitialis]|uniref:DUF4371 domain-containing protein n=1 Tax=Centaurea solstitialis TaxID=347529 RepID=A0AA38U127_9ASTR|nr:hypothetical protein OSB04_001177 [Centaurea solstitialis]